MNRCDGSKGSFEQFLALDTALYKNLHLKKLFFFQIEVLTDNGAEESESSVSESTTRPPDFNQFDGLFENEEEAEEEGGEEQNDRED